MTGAADRAAEIMAGLDLATKVSLLTGSSLWTTRGVKSIGLRPMALSDGPAGVRGIRAAEHVASASFPSPTALAATWDVTRASGLGAVFAAEAHLQGVDVVLAPCVNLQRTPYGGRHFENFSEDPLLVGRIASALVVSIQRHGVAATPKHFVGNESETERTSYRSVIGERALRELYLAPFADAVAAGAWVVMTAYNGVDDGVENAPMSEHRHLVVDVLKNEFGFDGVVVSDWMGARRTVPAALGGLDLAMPGPDGPWGQQLIDAVERGEVPQSVVDDKVERLLKLAGRVGALGSERTRVALTVDTTDVLRDLAARSTVVLHRTPGTIPLGSMRRMALIGPNAVEAFTQGGGSAHTNPHHVVSPEEGLRAALGTEVELRVAAGCASRLRMPSADPAALSAWNVRHYDRDGRLLGSTEATAGANPHIEPLTSSVVRVEVSGTITLHGVGEHHLGLHALGRHRSWADGRAVGHELSGASGEDVLTSTNNNPPGASTVITVLDGPTTMREVALVFDIEIPNLDDFGRWSVLMVRHQAPGPSGDDLMAAAVEVAVDSDVAVVVVGTNDEVESEGFDRSTLALPGRQDELVRAVLATGTPTIVVVNAGSPVVLPWLDDVAAVLWTWFPGQECGHALADVLLGRTEPAGRLPWTLPARESDVPVTDVSPREGRLSYEEGLFVGYRAWDRLRREPARPFGYGRGWSDWEVRGAKLLQIAPDGTVEILVSVANVGALTSTCVAQVYLCPPSAAEVPRPESSLAGFATVTLPPGVGGSVKVLVPPRALQIWDVTAQRWARPPGRYRLRAGLHSRDRGPAVDLMVNDDETFGLVAR